MRLFFLFFFFRNLKGKRVTCYAYIVSSAVEIHAKIKFTCHRPKYQNGIQTH